MANLQGTKRYYLYLCLFTFFFVCVVYFTAYSRPEVDLNSIDWSTFEFDGRAHDDPALIEFIRRRMVFPPAVPLPYHLEHPERRDFSINGQGVELAKIFGKKTKGFFVETGGFTGEKFSPTLFWERERYWQGILIEPLPHFYNTIVGKNRQAILLHAGLSPTNSASTLTFSNDWLGSKIIYLNESTLKTMPSSKYSRVPCFPMTSILAALGNPTVHLYSLDVESFELKVLRTMSLLALDVHVFMVEFIWLTEGYDALETHMTKNGYKTFAKLYEDAIFIKKGVQF